MLFHTFNGYNRCNNNNNKTHNINCLINKLLITRRTLSDLLQYNRINMQSLHVDKRGCIQAIRKNYDQVNSDAKGSRISLYKMLRSL